MGIFSWLMEYINHEYDGYIDIYGILTLNIGISRFFFMDNSWDVMEYWWNIFMVDILSGGQTWQFKIIHKWEVNYEWWAMENTMQMMV
jgi:hypothetical protein